VLTTSQRRRCAEIAQSLDRGDLTLWRRVEPSLSPAERGAIWDMRQEQITRGARRQVREAAVMDVHDFAAASNDLDFWADDEPEPDDDDDAPTMPCPVCLGSGRDKMGNRCASCNGTGRVRDDQEDNDEDEE
jgi:hypothetical protein